MAFLTGCQFLVELLEGKVVEGLSTVLNSALPGFFTTGTHILDLCLLAFCYAILVNGSALLRMGQHYLPAAYSHLSHSLSPF